MNLAEPTEEREEGILNPDKEDDAKRGPQHQLMMEQRVIEVARNLRGCLQVILCAQVCSPNPTEYYKRMTHLEVHPTGGT